MRKIFLLLFVALCASCATQRKVIYLQDNLINTDIETIEGGDITFKPNDVVSVFVSSKNPELATVFNLPRIQQTTGGGSSSGVGSGASQNGVLNYTVRKDGTLDYPIIGELYVEGLTKEELAKTIKQKILESNYINDPIVTVDFVNLCFSTVGEVGAPGTYNILKDQTSIFEALSMSGDLTINGVRDRVFLTRRNGDSVITYQLDLRSKDVYQSPAYYVQQNDVIYVEPNKIRANQTTVNGNTVRSASFWMSLASFLTSMTLLLIN